MGKNQYRIWGGFPSSQNSVLRSDRLESINDIAKYIDENIEYIDIADECDFNFYRRRLEHRPEYPFLKSNYGLTADKYFQMLKVDLIISRIKQRVEEKKMLMGQQEKQAALSEEDTNKKFEELRNIKRDSKGRLNKGAKLAKKDTCNETKIYLMHELGATVKEIVAYYGCSKSVVYRVLAKHK